MATEQTIVEEKSFSDLALERYLNVKELAELTQLSEEDHNTVSVETHLPKQLFGSIFVGHKATDLDSIASAIGAAELFKGVAARASEVNNETAHALKIWNLDTPLPYAQVLQEHPSRMTCIVDHNQKVQCPDHIDYDKLIGVIDHHAMQGGTVSTSSPIYVNIHPWGSACTIIATMFFQARRSMTRQTAGILLSGILSDTLNLRSPTTTEYDCLSVSLLAKFAKVDDINQLASSLFKAKSQELLRCTPHQLVRGDLKTFECHCRNPDDLTAPSKLVKMAFGVIETTDVAGLVALRDKLTFELRALKAEEEKDLTFMALVNIVTLDTHLILVGGRETDLATRVFNGEIDEETGLMHLKGLVSRKKDFIPPLEHYLSKKGWVMPDLSAEEQGLQKKTNFGRVELECTEFGCQTVRSDKVPGDDVCCDEEIAAATSDATKDTTTTTTTVEDANNQSSIKENNKEHRHHHPDQYDNKGLTAGALTRRLLNAYKLKGPHIPTANEVEEAVTFVLGATKAHLSEAGINISGPTKRTHSQMVNTTTSSSTTTANNNNNMDDSSIVPIPLDDIPATNQTKKQKLTVDATAGNSVSLGPVSPHRSPKQLAKTIDIASDVNHQKTEELINSLLDVAKTHANQISQIENTLQLPPKADFEDKIKDIMAGSDASLKFLLLALTHAVEDHEDILAPAATPQQQPQDDDKKMQ